MSITHAKNLTLGVINAILAKFYDSSAGENLDLTKLQTLLDEQMNWPDNYTFKFVVKSDSKHHVKALFKEDSIREKPSRNGNYTSITCVKVIESTEQVLEVYKLASKIEGIFSL